LASPACGFLAVPQALFTRMRYDSAGLDLGRGRVSLFTLGVSQRF